MNHESDSNHVPQVQFMNFVQFMTALLSNHYDLPNANVGHDLSFAHDLAFSHDLPSAYRFEKMNIFSTQALDVLTGICYNAYYLV